MITDENIHHLVKVYLSDKEALPDELKSLPIGEWDVSRVTNFDELFVNMRSFNEPLNWDTSNAVSMIVMFLGCTKFNQPLHWNVKKVKDMHGMFKECK